MIKNFQINQSQLLATHNKATSGHNGGLIVCKDSRRIYYQSPDSTATPFIIGESNFWTSLDNVQTQTLAVGRKYIHTTLANPTTVNLPTTEYACDSGDSILVFDACSTTVNYKQGGTTIYTKPAGAYDRYLRFYRSGSNWQVLTEGSEFASGITTLSSQITGRILKDLNSTTATIYPSALPSAAASGGYGIVTTISSTTIADYSTAANAKKVPLASAMIKIISAMISGVENTYLDGTSNNLITSSKLPLATVASSFIQSSKWKNAATWGLTQIEGSTSANIISGSSLPMAASAVYAYVEGQDINSKIAGRLSGVKINGSTYTELNGNALADLGNSYVQITEGTPEVGQYVVRTSSGYKTTTGIATLSSSVTITGTYNSSTNYTLSADGNAIPVMIKTNTGHYYPLEKGTFTFNSTSNKYEIDTRPYLAYEYAQYGSPATFTGPWYVYYGAGINDLYTTANTIHTETTTGSSYNALFSTADVHVINIQGGTGTFTITCPSVTNAAGGLSQGHGMMFKVINSAGRTVKFGNSTIITSSGTYSFSVFNFGTGVDRIGEITSVYAYTPPT